VIIAGLQKNSLIDYPGKLSCVVFLTGCNFTCPYCHNPLLARGTYPQRIQMDALLSFLSERRNFLDGVVITGGEPTLAAGLPDLCRAVGKLGLAVKLDTNGSRPDVLSGLLASGLLDYIAMDIKTIPGNYSPVFCDRDNAAGIVESIQTILTCGLDYEFRTTCVKPFISEPLIEQIARTIQGARRFTLQNLHAADMLASEYLPDRPAFTARQMQRLRDVAAPWVRRCSLR
jgi:pyruvate formate lyase activating enzyme